MSLEETFWMRARQTKEQTVKAVKSPWLAQRSKLMFLERERRSIDFEKQDEERRKAKAHNGFGPAATGGQTALTPASANGTVTNGTSSSRPKSAPTAPSIAFLGVSMLGNLVSCCKLDTCASAFSDVMV